MTATAHAIVGAAIATRIPNPAVAIPLSLVSHFLCDKIPHWDVMTDRGKPRTQLIRELTIDYLLSFAVVGAYIVFFQPTTNPILIYACALVAEVPDVAEGPYKLLHWNFPFSKLAYQIQSVSHDLWFDSRLKAPWGVVTQVVVMIIFLLWATAKK